MKVRTDSHNRLQLDCVCQFSQKAPPPVTYHELSTLGMALLSSACNHAERNDGRYLLAGQSSSSGSVVDEFEAFARITHLGAILEYAGLGRQGTAERISDRFNAIAISGTFVVPSPLRRSQLLV